MASTGKYYLCNITYNSNHTFILHVITDTDDNAYIVTEQGVRYVGDPDFPERDIFGYAESLSGTDGWTFDDFFLDVVTPDVPEEDIPLFIPWYYAAAVPAAAALIIRLCFMLAI